MKKSPVKLSRFPKRTRAENKLIRKNPYGDKDRDRVMNFFDCKPLNKNKQDVMLYHGTTQEAAKKIRLEGLKAGGITSRVFLTPNKSTAQKYAIQNQGIIFKVSLADAMAKKHGIPLKRKDINDAVTVTEDIPKHRIKGEVGN